MNIITAFYEKMSVILKITIWMVEMGGPPVALDTPLSFSEGLACGRGRIIWMISREENPGHVIGRKVAVLSNEDLSIKTSCPTKDQ